MTQLDEQDIRLDGVSTGLAPSTWWRATHLPTGTVVTSKRGECLTKDELKERLRAAVEALPLNPADDTGTET